MLTDKDLLRMILLAAGLVLLLGIYLAARWRRRKARPKQRERLDLDPEFRDVEPLAINPSEEIEADIEIVPLGPVSAFKEADEVSDFETGLREPGTPAVPSAEEMRPKQAISQKQLPLIQVSVVARRGQRFPGPRLHKLFDDFDLKYGPMEIFHRCDEDSGEIRFSVANLVEPGTFPQYDLNAFSCPGITLFSQLNEVADPEEAFEELIRFCSRAAAVLDGDIWDADRTTLTDEKVEALRAAVTEGVTEH